MKIKTKINWVITGIGLGILKRSLQHAITGKNENWLQPVMAKDVSVFNRVDFILDKCKDKKILHIGFSDYPFTEEKIKNNTLLHTQLKKVTVDILGLDNNMAAIQQYKHLTTDEQVVYGDITLKYPEEAIVYQPEIILLSEVLEHLSSPAMAVNILYDSFAHGTKILVTVPNYMALDGIAASLNKTESIHPHHYWYFSPFTLCKTFGSRFKLEQLHFGMYYQQGSTINPVLKKYPYNADCIIAIFSINKT